MIFRRRTSGMNSLRKAIFASVFAVMALVAAGCGSQGVEVSQDDPNYAGAVLFAERCSGCHTLTAAGTQGSKPVREVNSKDRTDGPNLDQRKVDYEAALAAIQGGGYSGAVMPANIVTGKEAEQVAKFIAEYSGQKQ